MIVLPSISQKKYIINKDTLVCYTFNENRKLSILLLEGDKNKELVRQDSVLINMHKELNVTYQTQIGNYKNQNSIYKFKNDSLNTKIANDKIDADKLASKNKTQKIILGTVSTISLVACLLLILIH